MQGAMTLGTLIVSLTLIHQQHLPVILRLYDEQRLSLSLVFPRSSIRADFYLPRR